MSYLQQVYAVADAAFARFNQDGLHWHQIIQRTRLHSDTLVKLHNHDYVNGPLLRTMTLLCRAANIKLETQVTLRFA